ncbi:MAG: response regulator transcription factor [Helicobacteraceae bacterium]|nr:response regulator transcription factor [Candidatus Sulfurimonas ponti]MBL6973667.1 response regulator transcription factor [Sulfurimonas sp.]
MLFKKVVIAKDGEEGFFSYKKESFDIVITDIQMPNMNGIELSRRIMGVNKNQKIIIVSAYNETQYFIELIKIGVAGFMQKPLTTVQMLDILYDVCLELDEQRDMQRYIKLKEDFQWDNELKVLSDGQAEVSLTANEKTVVELFISNRQSKFTDIEIFNHLYYDDAQKEFSSNSIKSLVKRLRKKMPQDSIQTHKNMGYSLKI